MICRPLQWRHTCLHVMLWYLFDIIDYISSRVSATTMCFVWQHHDSHLDITTLSLYCHSSTYFVRKASRYGHKLLFLFSFGGFCRRTSCWLWSRPPVCPSSPSGPVSSLRCVYFPVQLNSHVVVHLESELEVCWGEVWCHFLCSGSGQRWHRQSDL